MRWEHAEQLAVPTLVMVAAHTTHPFAQHKWPSTVTVARTILLLGGLASGPAMIKCLNNIEPLRFLRVGEVLWIVAPVWVVLAWILAGARSLRSLWVRCLLGGAAAGLLSGAGATVLVFFLRSPSPVLAQSALLGVPLGLLSGAVGLWPAALPQVLDRRGALDAGANALLLGGLWLTLVAGVSLSLVDPSPWALLPTLALAAGLLSSAWGLARKIRLSAWVRRVRRDEVPGWEIRELGGEQVEDLPLLFWLRRTLWYDLLVYSQTGTTPYRLPDQGTSVALIPRRSWPTR